MEFIITTIKQKRCKQMIDMDLIDIQKKTFNCVKRETKKAVNRSLLTYLEVLNAQD